MCEQERDYTDEELDAMLDGLLASFDAGGAPFDGIVYDEERDPWPPLVIVPAEG